ncbi:hypothetical protein Poli38472_002163 [Pythium oligandrum]|uniref:TFIIE beta domain-containing protein n=1 Tax=Pythium oligandrum TaxID=41045 RepID=A0A8K1CJA0_PYTOL|nr:hypothetical protein Poli38472_002163 [Pythium oligandrum]|eukprot:TMW63222.1 hypothetical protein Poli38472_002163 [Pythium oligandrum]
MSWRNLAYGSQAAAEAAPTVAPAKLAPVKEVVPQVDASSVPKNDGAKVYKILEYLRKIPMHQPVSVKDVFQHTGIDLTMDEQVDQRLKNNPKVRVDGEMYAYQAKYDIKNRMQLLKILERMPEGMPIEDFIDCYVGVENDLNELSRTGEIICLKNAENGAEVFYPRGMQFLVDVSGVATVEPGCYYAHSTVDISGEVRRGDAIRVGDQWFRASAAVKTNSSARPAAFAGMASKSVASTRDPNVSKKIRYLLKFDKDHIPLDAPFPDAKRREIVTDRWDSLPQRGPKFQMIKHGCTNDIRQLWRDTLRHWPTDRAEFEKKLVQAGLTTQAKVDANRRQIKRRLKEDKRKPRMRKQREIKISNDHLIGTELGEILAKGGDDGFTLGAVKFEKS